MGHHAHLKWRDKGGVLLGPSRTGEADTPYSPGVRNLTVESDSAVDELLAYAVVTAGAVVIAPPLNPPHGGRIACVADFDGNHSNVDSYPRRVTTP